MELTRAPAPAPAPARSAPRPADPGRPAPPPAPAAVELHVDSLVLSGFRPEDRHRIGAALQAELGRLLAERGVPRGLEDGIDAAVLRAAAVDLPRDAHPATVGGRLARSVYAALAGARRAG